MEDTYEKAEANVKAIYQQLPYLEDIYDLDTTELNEALSKIIIALE